MGEGQKVPSMPMEQVMVVKEGCLYETLLQILSKATH